MAHKKRSGLHILKETTRGVTLGTLLTATALSVESGHGTGLLQSFLMKKVMANIYIDNGTPGQGPILVGMAQGDKSVSEIKSALEQIELERDLVDQATIKGVLHETLRMITFGHTIDGGNVVHMNVSLGGGKGIPFEEGDGWQWFVYNVGSGALATTAPAFHMDATYYGVFL